MLINKDAFFAINEMLDRKYKSFTAETDGLLTAPKDDNPDWNFYSGICWTLDRLGLPIFPQMVGSCMQLLPDCIEEEMPPSVHFTEEAARKREMFIDKVLRDKEGKKE